MNDEDSSAKASIILGVLSILFPLMGLILGILGLSYANKTLKITDTSENYRGMAMGGKICSIVGICLQVLLILLISLGVAIIWSFT
ncbi:DUF4190 domain-containing protein [Halobacillus seohaensis]|uniref:DUF4190 domain-containing protein n=1 Tax=Halobacillus seohaensis TaxID=447421 RepID=A0ABW2EIF2_9BACI